MGIVTLRSLPRIYYGEGMTKLDILFSLSIHMKKGLILLLAAIFLLIGPSINASEPERHDNKFGIHLAQPHHDEIKKAAELVNSNGGDWGYITLIIQENDRSIQKWQEIFDLLRQYHLIPIIRLATQPESEVWKRPNKDDAKSWADFLNQLNWVVKNRYVILFNETNHGQEWGGEVDPESYSEVAFSFAKTLKEINPDFFIMLAGLDLSAPSSYPNYEDAEVYLRSILNSKFQILNSIDGLSSHSYPNPGFSGSPWDIGRKSIRGYQWELELLKELGIKKEFPVFITETGWDGNRVNRDTVADNYQTVYEQVWLNDDRVKAVTPFVLDYQGDPFLGFSWKKVNSQEYYQQFDSIKSMKKTKGDPEIIEKGTLTFDFPTQLATDSYFNLPIKITNLGQGWWDKDANYYLTLDNFPKELYSFSDLKDIKLNEEVEINLYIKTSGLINSQSLQFSLYHDQNKIITSKAWKFDILGLPDLNIQISILPKLVSNGEDLEIQVYDKQERLVFKRKGIKLNNGKGVITKIQNIVFGDIYRIVVLKPLYLPRQAFIAFKKEDNILKYKPLVPLDLNRDGKFSFNDITEVVKNPSLIKLFVP